MSAVVEEPRYFTLLPREAYVSQEIYSREIDRIFTRQWTFIAHERQLREAGDFVVEEIAGESIIVVRDDAGEIHAFFNVCRHRGYQFCEQAQGSVKRFICPYHRWSYGRDGALLHAPDSPDGEFFNYEDWGLHRVHLERWHGLIFVALGEVPPAPLTPALDRFGGEMVPAQLKRLREAARETYEINANWKTMLENYLECYHCRGSHHELCRAMSLEQMYATNLEWEGEYNGGVTPLNPGYKTMSMDGELLSRPLGDFAAGDTLPENFGGGFMIVPLLTRIICHVDHMVVHLLRPLTVDRTRWETRWYVHEDAVEGGDYDVKRLTEMWATTNRQDIGLVEGAFRGVRSRAFVSGPLHAEREPAIRGTLEKYRELMGTPQ